MTIIRNIEREAEAARCLLLNIRDVIADDEQAVSDAIEGETNLKEAFSSAVARLMEVDAFVEALDAQIKSASARKSRFALQAEMIRAAILSAMGASDLTKIELAAATLTRKSVPPKIEITSEADVPSRFWIAQPPKLDRKSVLDALKSDESVPGAVLSNGGETLQIKRV